jgi:hypothetical protein
MRNLVARNDSN